MTENEKIFIQNGERLDNIGFGELMLIQKPDEFCYGVDAVLLSDFAASGGGRYRAESYGRADAGYSGKVSVLDLGTGTGIVPLILSHKISSAVKIVGLEIQAASAERAIRSVALNRLSDRIKILCGDVSESGTLDKLSEMAGGAFDIVTTNPPYFESGKGPISNNKAKMIARTESTGTLEDFISAASKLLKDKGDFYMVHRPARLVDICCLCRKYKIEPKAIRMVSPREGEEPNILLLHGVRSGGRELKVRKPLAVYNADGGYTHEINMIYER